MSCKNISLCNLRPKDLVSIETVWESSRARYLVIKVNKKSDSLDVLPLEDFFANSSLQKNTPVLSVPCSMIKSMVKLDRSSLFFLADNSNPHIINALENMT